MDQSTHNNPLPFLPLPAELRMYVYQAVIGSPSIVSHICDENYCYHQLPSNRKMCIHARDAKGRKTGKDIMNLLLVSKSTYLEVAPMLFSSGLWVTSPRGLFKMLHRAGRLTRSTSSCQPISGINLRPEKWIRCLVLSTGKRTAPTTISVRDAMLRDLRTALAALEHHFPKLEQLVISVARHDDLFGNGTIPRIVSPLCCLHNVKSIRFFAEDVMGRTGSKSASRLRIESANLKALGEVLSRRTGVLGSGHLHEAGKCQYRGSQGGNRLVKDILAWVLKAEHGVKVQKLR